MVGFDFARASFFYEDPNVFTPQDMISCGEIMAVEDQLIDELSRAENLQRLKDLRALYKEYIEQNNPNNIGQPIEPIHPICDAMALFADIDFCTCCLHSRVLEEFLLDDHVHDVEAMHVD
jgi:hypothetical protein